MAIKSSPSARPRRNSPGKKAAGAAGAVENGSRNAAPENTSATQAYPEIEEEIRQRAYELYEQRGRQDGLQEEDWARAEAEILSRNQRQKSA